MDAGVFVPEYPCIYIGSVRIPPHIIADATMYPIREWLMKPHGGHEDRQWMNFDCSLPKVHIVVECAFGRGVGHMPRMQK